MKTYERFLNYIKVNTTSDENSTTHPTTKRQFNLAYLLKKEMDEIGFKGVIVDKNSYIYGYIPATKGYEEKKKIGFISHIDTAPAAKGEDIKAQIVENYDGNDISLGKSTKVLSPKRFPHLKKLKGRTLITTDGTTLLGADDKAGIAEIITACFEIINEKIPHGKIAVSFTPDEEVGLGASLFNLDLFDSDIAYTVDGGEEGELSFENFNAAEAKVIINGISVHPGSAKNIMVNAVNVGMEFNSFLPKAERPEYTENYEGFYYLESFTGNTERAELNYILRDHSDEKFKQKKDLLNLVVKLINEKYGKNTTQIKTKDQYKNMKEIIEKNMDTVDNAKKAMKNLDILPIIEPIRGGTDGAMLSFKGLPCPNLGTGGFAFHGEYEHITVEGMEKSKDIIKEIVKVYAL
ncbi:peptidase T [Clostridium sp. BJN0001]|uniref:peptidase T n=1 Tax=Clostridium sp. BJN0001 TaxID=2930219 RepID=UPI001FD46FCC|nr:peptidase T [Clostridium sp. BJN0001]